MAIRQTPELERALHLGVERKASDLYLLPNEPISLRIAGIPERTDGPPLSPEDVRQIAVAAVGEERLADIGPACGRVNTSCSLPGVMSGRMTIARSRGDYTIVVRLMPGTIPTLAQIRFPEAVVEAAKSPNGLILFSGPGGSGKATSMIALIEDINQREAMHICTVEDPVGPTLTPKKSFIQQHDVGSDCPDVISGIAAAMSQDPDIFMISDLRRVEEVQAALVAVQTGHLVFSTIHSITPAEAIQKLIDIQPSEHLPAFRGGLASEIVAVTTQRLVRRASGKGRTAAYGVLILDDEMWQALRNGRSLLERTTPLPKGCQTLAEDIEKMRREGVVTDEVARNALAGQF